MGGEDVVHHSLRMDDHAVLIERDARIGFHGDLGAAAESRGSSTPVAEVSASAST